MMYGLLNLNRPVSRTSKLDLDDVLKMKRALMKLNLYKPHEEDGLDTYSDEPLFEGIQTFQKRNGLQIDGVVNPDGETAEALDKTLRRKGVGAATLAAPLAPPPRTGPIPIELDAEIYGSNRRTADAVLKTRKFGDLPDFMFDAWNKRDRGKVEMVDLIDQVRRRDPAQGTKLWDNMLERMPAQEIDLFNELWTRRVQYMDALEKGNEPDDSDKPEPGDPPKKPKPKPDEEKKKRCAEIAREIQRMEREIDARRVGVERALDKVVALQKALAEIRERIRQAGGKVTEKVIVKGLAGGSTGALRGGVPGAVAGGAMAAGKEAVLGSAELMHLYAEQERLQKELDRANELYDWAKARHEKIKAELQPQIDALEQESNALGC